VQGDFATHDQTLTGKRGPGKELGGGSGWKVDLQRGLLGFKRIKVKISKVKKKFQKVGV